MKYIYKISILLLSVLTFIGCNVDDDDQMMVYPTKNISAKFVDQRNVIPVSDNATSYDLVINFSEPLPSYSSIEYSVDGGAKTSVSASSGDSSVTISVPFDISDNSHVVDLSDFIIVNSQARRFNASFDGKTSTTLIRQGYFTATMTWADASDDIDFGLQPMTATWASTFDWIDVSLNFFPPEFLEGEELNDGNYAIYAQFYTPANEVEVNYALQTAAGNFSFDLVTSENGNRLWFTKSTDADGNVSYTFYTQDPS